MAESDVLKKEDVDDITDALQVAPHQKNNQFSAVSKSEEGDLVSLDELYEKTGQEAINTFIHGFEELARTGRLSREHGLALNVAGAESWLPLPDVFNARIGQEGFVQALKKGAVAIIKAIVAFIKGVANWVYTRLKSLLGFSRTVNEAKYVHFLSQDYRNLAATALGAFNLPVFDKDEYLKTLSDDLTKKEIFQLTKSRFDSNKDAFNRLQEAQLFLANHTSTINKWNKNIQQAKRGSDAIVQQFRRLLNKRAAVHDFDFLEYSLQYSALIRDHLNPEKPTEYLSQLVNLLYGIEFTDIGIDKGFNELRDTLKKSVETIKAGYDPQIVAGIDETLRYLYKIRFDQPQRMVKIDQNLIETLKKSVSDDDMSVINAIDNLIPQANLSQAYITYAKAASTYADAIDMILTLVQRTDKLVCDMLLWQAKINELCAATVANDLLQINEVIESFPDDPKKQLTPLAQFLYLRLEEQYHHRYQEENKFPDFVSWFSHYSAAFFKTNEGRQLIKVVQKHKARLLS